MPLMLACSASNRSRSARPEARQRRRALARLVEGLGAQVIGLAFLIELAFLGGRATLADKDVVALLTYA